jgi:pimeloyl-ACP methyl ester carboxylesterase
VPSTRTGTDTSGLAHRWITVNGVRLHCVEAGTGPLVVRLHGFPELWYAWRHQIPALADAGFRVVAPDLRGYNLSDKPPRVRDYRSSTLAQDVADLIVALDAGSAAVAGHDWGGAVAWLLAMLHPQRVERLVVLNAPHPVRFLHGLRSLRQLRRSWYMVLFQLPWLPERLVRAGDFRGLRRTLRRDPVRPEAFNDQDIDRYVQAAAQPGAMRAAINYYRAAVRTDPLARLRSLRRVEAPTLVIWGEQDRYLGSELADPDDAWVPDVRVERIAGASHWLQADAPKQVNQLLLAFLEPMRRSAGAQR